MSTFSLRKNSDTCKRKVKVRNPNRIGLQKKGLSMADEVFKNGATNGEDQTNENSHDLDRENDIKIAELTRKVGVLEQEKADLIREYVEVKERIEKVTAESEEMKSAKDEMNKMLEEMMKEIEQSESDKKALESIAARAASLETEVSRLQHDLISAMSEGEEANAEVTQLKRMLQEKELTVENLVKESNENESRLRDLEEKIRVMEVKVSETNEEKVKIEQETEKKIANREREISNLKSDIGELISSIEKLKMQQKQDEEMRNNESKEAKSTELALDEALKEIRELKEVVKKLEEIREAKAVAKTQQDTQYEGVNGIASHSYTGNEANEPLAFKWQVALLSTGTFAAAAAAWYLRHRRQRLD